MAEAASSFRPLAEDDPSGSMEEGAKPSGFSLKLFRYAGGLDWLLITISMITNFASGLILPIFFRLFGDIMDSVALPGGTNMIFYVKLLLVFGGGAFVLCSIGAFTMEYAAERQVQELKKQFLSAITRQEMGWFDKFNPGKLSSTLSQNTATLREGIGLKLSQLFMFAGMFLGGYAVGFWSNWKMTLVVTSGLPVMVVSAGLMMRELSNSDSLARKAYASAAAVVEESLLSIKTVAAYGLEERAMQLFGDRLGESYKAGIRTSMGIALTYGLMFGVFYFIEALAFWYGGKLVSDDLEVNGLLCYVPENDGGAKCVQGGEVLAVFFCVVIGAFAMAQAGPPISAVSKASSALTELDDIIRRETEIHPNDTSKPPIERSTLQGGVTFDHVKFAYPTRPDRPVFADLNLVIEAGKSTALVGASGCGKSTIVQLIERYYDVSGGDVLLDGQTPINSVNLRSWREKVALVSQEPRLFATTIKENIRVGKLDATDEEIMMAAKQANAHDFINEFPQKYDTFVGQGGGQLSGGQKQRIAIARAILRDPAILILDEATSALDNESEKIVQETLDKLLETSRRTTIIIAHRLTTVRRADRIIVLQNDGQGATVAESGTHHELMTIDKGIYRMLVEAQSLAANDEDEELAEAVQDIAAGLADIPPRSKSLLELQSKFSRDLSKSASKGSVELSRIPHEQPATDAKKKKGPGNFRKVARVLLPYWPAICVGLLGAVANGMVFPVYTIIFSKLLGALYQITPDEIRKSVSTWALALVGLGIGAFLGAALQNGMFTWAGVKVIRETRYKLFNSILYQDQGFFDAPENSLGTLSDMLAADAVLIRGMVGDNIGLYLQNIVCVVAAIVITFMANVKLAGVAIGCFCLMAPASIIEAKFTLPQPADGENLKGDTIEDVETAPFLLQETILNVRTVGAYTLEDEMDTKYQRIVDKDFRKGRKRAVLTGFAWGLSQLTQYGCQALLLWYGGKLVEDGEISPEAMFRGIMALMMAAMGVGQTMAFATDATKARAAADRIYTVYEKIPLVDSRNRSKLEFQGFEQSINFDHVRFTYPQRPEIPVYKDLTFQIKKGETVALVGQSGCGKSTVVQLLERFYPHGDETDGADLRAGLITFDNVDMRDYNVRSLRDRIGLVSQEPNLFDAGVRENIELGKYGQDVSWSEVEAAARAANAYDFVQAFPEGFDTNVGRFGGRLSGGQKQRVAIARAIIRDPEILVLDEATSALDAESEEVVQAALDKLIEEGNRTTIVIAHRLSTVKKADKIVVLVNKRDGTKVAEVGTHNELLKIEKGVYRKLVEITQVNQ